MLSLGVVVVSVAVLRCEGGDDDYDHVSNSGDDGGDDS